MSAPELLPCPFCGESPSYSEHWDEDLSTHNQVIWKSVSCMNDCASVSIPDGYDGGNAIERWNTRADLCATDPRTAALSDPNAVHINMLRGSIARPTIAQIIHVYGADELRAALASWEA